MTDRSHIEHPVAYENAVSARIKANASKTRRAKWLAVEGNQRLYDWLNAMGEFRSRIECSAHTEEEHMLDDYNGGFERQWCDSCRTIDNPLVKGMFAGDFGKLLMQMRDSLDEWGHLTEKQTTLVANALARAEKWEAERQAKYAAKREEELASSAYVGTVGERRDFTLTVERTMAFEGDYGYTYFNICKDSEGRVVVYKGSNGWNKGETLTVKATIKEHSEHNGIKQTIIQRPKII